MSPLEKQTLFWDVDLKTLDQEAHAKFIVERILDRGDMEDVRWLLGNYSPERVRDVIEHNRIFSRKSENFWRLYFNLPPCIPKQSQHIRDPFWMR